MRLLTLLLGALLVTLITTEVSASPQSYTCKIQTGYGTAIGHGASKLAAKEAARETCGSKIIDQYFAQRGRIPAEVQDDLVLSCVNLECQQ